MAIANILLVDDEKPFVEAMTRRLQNREVDVLAVYSGMEALEALKKHRNIEVVVLDVKMPNMDGIDTLREIKRHHPLVEVIMLTGHATVESGIEGMKLGAYDYLMKPCELDVLIEKVSEAAAKKREHEEKIVQARIHEIIKKKWA
jgi:DNA-binding NtrC family response regulator